MVANRYSHPYGHRLRLHGVAYRVLSVALCRCDAMIEHAVMGLFARAAGDALV